jgi:hypothetical protein
MILALLVVLGSILSAGFKAHAYARAPLYDASKLRNISLAELIGAGHQGPPLGGERPVLVFFADPYCAACESERESVFDLATRSEPIAVVYRHFLLRADGINKRTAIFAEIAKERGKMRRFFSGLSSLGDRSQNPKDVDALMRQLGFDMDEVSQRLMDPADPACHQVLADVELGRKFDLHGVPFMLLIRNGRMEPIHNISTITRDAPITH